MSQSRGRQQAYTFGDELPVEGIPPGSNVLIAGPGTSAARELALELVLAGSDREEGMILVSTNTQGSMFLNQCEQLHPELSRSQLRIIDATPDPERPNSEIIKQVGNTRDLSGIGIEYSACADTLREEGVTRIRAGVFSVTALLLENEFKTVSKLLHILTGRVSSSDGLGVFYLDTNGLQDRVVSTLAELCDGRIDVRTKKTTGPPSQRRKGGTTHQLRAEGLPDQPREWTPFVTSLQWPREVGSHAIDRRVGMASGASQQYRCLGCDYSATGELDLSRLSELRCDR